MFPITVVIADDHAAVRASLRLLMECDPSLKLIGEANDGLQAIQAVHALQPDLLLMDIKMPQMSGLEVLQYLRNEQNPVAVIILSNHSESLYVEAALRLGANAFVAKSAGLEALMNAIQSIRTSLFLNDPAAESAPLEGCPAATQETDAA